MAAGSFRYPYHISDLESSLFGEPAPPKSKIDAAIALLEDNARALEDYVSGLSQGFLPPFDFPGPLAVATSDLLCPQPGVTLTVSRFMFTLKAVSTLGAVSVGVYKTTTLIETVSIPAGTQLLPVILSSPAVLIGGVDYLQLGILATGTGASGLLGWPA